MDLFFKAAAGILLAVILSITLRQKGAEISMVLSITVCVMAGILAFRYLQPVLEYLRTLQVKGNVQHEAFDILLQAVGVSLISEILVLICTDSGNAAMGKALQLLASTVVLYIAMPMLSALVDLVTNILGEL